ncbi:TspO/MBR family protein [Chloroflexota bacterium]
MENIKLQDVFRLLASIVACQCAGLIGSVFTMPAIPTWYAALQKPFFTPPNWLFAPAWATLYLLMGISAFIIWRRGLSDKPVREALFIFGVQLVINALWSVVFFGLKSPLSGIIVIVALWIAILYTMYKFYKLSPVAALLLIPYILWVSFAAGLNVSIWLLNP